MTRQVAGLARDTAKRRIPAQGCGGRLHVRAFFRRRVRRLRHGRTRPRTHVLLANQTRMSTSLIGRSASSSDVSLCLHWVCFTTMTRHLRARPKGPFGARTGHARRTLAKVRWRASCRAPGGRLRHKRRRVSGQGDHVGDRELFDCGLHGVAERLFPSPRFEIVELAEQVGR